VINDLLGLSDGATKTVPRWPSQARGLKFNGSPADDLSIGDDSSIDFVFGAQTLPSCLPLGGSDEGRKLGEHTGHRERHVGHRDAQAFERHPAGKSDTWSRPDPVTEAPARLQPAAAKAPRSSVFSPQTTPVQSQVRRS